MTADDRLRLACVGLHPDRRRSLVARLGSSAEVVQALISGAVGVSPEARLAARRSVDSLRSEVHTARLRVLDRNDDGFPPALASDAAGPDVLFVRGADPASRPGVAIVGTRRCTRYGTTLARRFGAAVANAGWPVVSGLARGIDGSAHVGSLDGHGVGTAVLGCGPDLVYPPEHRDLAEQLCAAGGSIVSEYPPGARPLPWRFPPRNRIIAALSGAVVVVESAERGGALVTAAAGAELGRAVFAVPGDVDREASRGCNLLIRDGAIPALGVSDLIEGLSLILGPAREDQAAQALFDPLEAAVLAAASSPASLDELVIAVQAAPAAVLGAVTRLEMGGRIVRDPSGVIVAR